MKVKKYIVNDIKEALEQIKRDLGEDAVILSTRSIRRGGFLGIGAKRYLEVTAVCEDKPYQGKVENNEVYK
ncbi:MAG: flagellar biosynthesis protein FlhF, partial [Pseudothermotoga sp.]